MKAVVFPEHGDERVPPLTEFPEPAVDARDVLVRLQKKRSPCGNLVRVP